MRQATAGSLAHLTRSRVKAAASAGVGGHRCPLQEIPVLPDFLLGPHQLETGHYLTGRHPEWEASRPTPSRWYPPREPDAGACSGRAGAGGAATGRKDGGQEPETGVLRSRWQNKIYDQG